jgi:hypothetical protein
VDENRNSSYSDAHIRLTSCDDIVSVASSRRTTPASDVTALLELWPSSIHAPLRTRKNLSRNSFKSTWASLDRLSLSALVSRTKNLGLLSHNHTVSLFFFSGNLDLRWIPYAFFFFSLFQKHCGIDPLKIANSNPSYNKSLVLNSALVQCYNPWVEYKPIVLKMLQ